MAVEQFRGKRVVYNSVKSELGSFVGPYRYGSHQADRLLKAIGEEADIAYGNLLYNSHLRDLNNLSICTSQQSV